MEVLDTFQPGDTVTFEGDRIRLKDKAGPTTSSVTINRVAPEATVASGAVLWPGRPDMCRLAEDAQGLHLAATVNEVGGRPCSSTAPRRGFASSPCSRRIAAPASGAACCRRRRLKLCAGAATRLRRARRNGRVLRKARLRRRGPALREIRDLALYATTQPLA